MTEQPFTAMPKIPRSRSASTDMWNGDSCYCEDCEAEIEALFGRL